MVFEIITLLIDYKLYKWEVKTNFSSFLFNIYFRPKSLNVKIAQRRMFGFSEERTDPRAQPWQQ